jgi:hypothetical protein
MYEYIFVAQACRTTNQIALLLDHYGLLEDV